MSCLRVCLVSSKTMATSHSSLLFHLNTSSLIHSSLLFHESSSLLFDESSSFLFHAHTITGMSWIRRLTHTHMVSWANRGGGQNRRVGTVSSKLCLSVPTGESVVYACFRVCLLSCQSFVAPAHSTPHLPPFCLCIAFCLFFVFVFGCVVCVLGERWREVERGWEDERVSNGPVAQ